MKTSIFVFALLLAPAAFAQNSPLGPASPEPSESPSELAPGKELRPRRHNISGDFSRYQSESKSTTSTGGDTTRSEGKTETEELEFYYGYELGYVQPFFIWSYTKESDKKSSDETREWGLVGGARVSFLENKPGNNFIPFAFLAMNMARGDAQAGTKIIGFDANGTVYGLGLDWYPFGEIFAVRATYQMRDLSVSGDNDGLPMRGNIEQQGLTLGYLLSF